MRRPHDIRSHEAIETLSRVGTAALPVVDDLAPAHLFALESAMRSAPTAAMRVNAPMPHSMWSGRRSLVLVAAAAFVAVPSMAIAGVLPDPVQRAASNAAAHVGVHLPGPAADRAVERTTQEPGTRSEDSRPDAGAADTKSKGTGLGLGEETRGTVPGKPEPGEQRGNRFGQVEGGPDQGQAGTPAGSAAKPAKPAPSRKPATPPGQVSDTAPATTTPAPTPAPPSNGNAGGSGGGGGGGKPDKG